MYYIIRTKHDRSVLGVASNTESANRLKLHWEDFLNDGKSIEILPCLIEVAATSPQDRIFHVYTDDEGLSFSEGLRGEIRYTNDTEELPEGKSFGVPHVDEVSTGKFKVDLYLAGWDFLTIDELRDEAHSLISAAIQSYIDDASQPQEQRFDTEDVVHLWFLTKSHHPSFRLGYLIDRLEDEFGFHATESLGAVVKLVDEGVLLRNGNTVTLNTQTRANIIQDQSSSFDGEVIL